jgi:hypothetical protein
METNDLKYLWNDLHTSGKANLSDEGYFKKSITMDHCKTIAKVLKDVKLKILVSSMVFLIYTGLMVYAFVFLRLKLSVYSLVPLAMTGLFLLFISTSEIVRLLVLTRTTDNLSVKESLLSFRSKLHRIKTVDFLSYLIFMYLSVIVIIFNYLSDIGGIRNLSRGNDIIPLPLLIILISMLLLIPWFIKYQHNKRYKNLYSSLNYSASQLEDLT